VESDGERRARACRVSNVTVSSTAAALAAPPAEAVADKRSAAVRRSSVSCSADSLACSENAGSAGGGGSAGISENPRLRTMRVVKEITAYRK
jgi:hypothetical protein